MLQQLALLILGPRSTSWAYFIDFGQYSWVYIIDSKSLWVFYGSRSFTSTKQVLSLSLRCYEERNQK